MAKCKIIARLRWDFFGVRGFIRFSPFTGNYFYDDRQCTGTGITGATLDDCIKALQASVYWSNGDNIEMV